MFENILSLMGIAYTLGIAIATAVLSRPFWDDSELASNSEIRQVMLRVIILESLLWPLTLGVWLKTRKRP